MTEEIYSTEHLSPTEYILSNQPVELLVKQMSDPNVTFKDVQNLCNTNRQSRHLCITNPLLRDLIEGKRTAVVIDRKSGTEEAIDEFQIIRPDIFKFLIYAYIGKTFLTINFTLEPLVGIEEMETFFLDILGYVKNDEEDDDGLGRDELLFRLDPASQRVTINIRNEYPGAVIESGTLPYVLFESIMTEAQKMVDNNEYGKIRILINGDVQHRR